MLLSSGDKLRHERLWPFQWLGLAWPHFSTVARLLSPLLPIFHILLHFLRLLSCFYEDLTVTVFWPSWWLRWTQGHALFWLVLVSSKFWTLWQVLVSLFLLAMCFKSLFEPMSSVAIESVTKQSIVFMVFSLHNPSGI